MDMRILLAAADRDLLRSYQSLLEEALGETVTAFDGTQVLTLAAEDPFDVVVLDRDIPRVHYRHIVQRLSNADIPVIVLMPEPQTSLLLQGDPLANAYLSFPFTSAAMIDTIRDVTAKKASGRRFSCGGQEGDVPAFRFTGAKGKVPRGETALQTAEPGLENRKG